MPSVQATSASPGSMRTTPLSNFTSASGPMTVPPVASSTTPPREKSRGGW